MFILKETENSDVRCGSVITNFETMDEAQQRMRGLYQKTVDIMGGNLDAEEDEDCCPENQRWATVSARTTWMTHSKKWYTKKTAVFPMWKRKKVMLYNFSIPSEIWKNCISVPCLNCSIVSQVFAL